jgi:predicted nucleotidyltransferase
MINSINSNNNIIIKKKIKSKNSIKILKEIIRIIKCRNKNKKKVKVKKIYSNY